MAFESEEIRKRQQRRRQERQRRAEQQKRQKQIVTGLIAAAVVLGLCAGLFALLGHDSRPKEPEPSGTTQTSPSTGPTEPETVIHIAFGGDLNVTDKTVASGETGAGYDYTDVFMDMVPLFAGADAAVLNFEGTLGAVPYGTPDRTSAPQQMMDALAKAGVDLIQMANSCSINNGLLGLRDTLSGIRQAGMEPVGAFSGAEEFKKSGGYTLYNAGGVKIAFVAFTKGVGSLGLPEGSEDCVNLLYTDYTSTYQDVDTDGIRAVLQAAAQEQPDVTIALLHWGSEYNNVISASQDKIVKLMQKEGVDAIIGTHSHFVQRLDYDAQAGTVVAYSLGDLYGNADKANTNYSIVLDLEITRDNRTGAARITDCTYTPIFTVTDPETGAPVRLARIREAMAAYEENHINKVSQETYEAMKTALSRINARLEAEA